METTRQQRISRLIQKEISDIFQGQTRSMNGVLISTTIVRVSPDLGTAKIYISVFPANKSEEILIGANKATKQIRYELAHRTRHQLRTVPQLSFYADDSLDYIENIDNLLK